MSPMILLKKISSRYWFKKMLYVYFRISSLGKINAYLKKEKIKKIHIGCGPYIIRDWLNTDISFKKNATYLDAGKKIIIKDNAIDFIFSEHVFEHLNFDQALNLLSESYRILKPGGAIRIATPNMDFLLKLYNDEENDLHKKYISWSAKKFLPKIYEYYQGNSALKVFVINNFFRDWGHQIIHTRDSITKMMQTAGFNEIRNVNIGESDFPELRGLEQHHNSIPREFNELETIIMEGVKKN